MWSTAWYVNTEGEVVEVGGSTFEHDRVQSLGWQGPFIDQARADTAGGYREGTRAEKNTGAACWSCQGLLTHAASGTCVYPENHGRTKTN